MGSWSMKQGIVVYRWGSDWDQIPRDKRLKLIEGFANCDACITGGAREIVFFRKGKRVGEASPSTGIRLID